MNEPSFLWQSKLKSPELKNQPEYENGYIFQSQNTYRQYKHIWNTHYGILNIDEVIL